MKFVKLNIEGKESSIDISDKLFSEKINLKNISGVIYKINANYKGRKAKTKQKNEIIKDFLNKNSLEEISQKFNLDFAQMSIKFCEIQPFVTSVIIGATTMQQLKTNVESVNVNLNNEIINEINEVQKIYPNPCP